MSERYDIVSKIGEGGVGAVYKGFDNHLGRSVAIKRLLPKTEMHVDRHRMLADEASVLSSLQHPNVVTVYDYGVDDEGSYVVMEYLEGETFTETIKRGALTYRDFISVAEQTLEGLLAAQDKGLMHRDIKPGNVMINWLPCGKFQVKLLDFGLAKYGLEPKQQTVRLGNAIMGSIYFLAPEQLERDSLDQRTDLYALGCVLYFGLTGRNPFTGDTIAQVMSAHLEHAVDDLKGLRTDLPPEICEWGMQMISRNKEDRPHDASEALKLFRRLVKRFPPVESLEEGVAVAPIFKSDGSSKPNDSTSIISNGVYAQAIPTDQIPLQDGKSVTAVRKQRQQNANSRKRGHQSGQPRLQSPNPQKAWHLPLLIASLVSLSLILLVIVLVTIS